MFPVYIFIIFLLTAHIYYLFNEDVYFQCGLSTGAPRGKSSPERINCVFARVRAVSYALGNVNELSILKSPSATLLWKRDGDNA